MAFLQFKVDLPKQELSTEDRYDAEISNHPSLKYLLPSSHLSPLQTCKSKIGAQDHPTAKYLITLTVQVFGLICFDMDFAHPMLSKHIAPDATTEQDGRITSRGREELWVYWTRIMKAFPDYAWEFNDAVAEISACGKNAKVWTSKRLSNSFKPAADRRRVGSNLTFGTFKENAGVLKWELQKDTWVATGYQMLSGLSGVA